MPVRPKLTRDPDPRARGSPLYHFHDFVVPLRGMLVPLKTFYHGIMLLI